MPNGVDDGMFLVRSDDAVLEVVPPARLRQSPMAGRVVPGGHCHITDALAIHQVPLSDRHGHALVVALDATNSLALATSKQCVRP